MKEPYGKGRYLDASFERLSKLGRIQLHRHAILGAHVGLQPSSQCIGVLLLGFDLKHAPLTNHDLDELLGPCFDEWTPAHGPKEGVTWDDSFPMRRDRGFRERCWFWYRPVAKRPTAVRNCSHG